MAHRLKCSLNLLPFPHQLTPLVPLPALVKLHVAVNAGSWQPAQGGRVLPGTLTSSWQVGKE